MFLIFESIRQEKFEAKERKISPYRSQFICEKHRDNLRGASSTCIYCSREYRKKAYLKPAGREQARKDYIKLKNKGHFEKEEIREKRNRYRREYHHSDRGREVDRLNQKAYAKTERGKQVAAKSQKNYRDNNPEARFKKQYWDEKRRAIKLNETPKWNDESITQQIFYLTQAINVSLDLIKKNERYEVDHIIPLNSKNVCGLHVWYNLIPIKGTDNSAKGNKIPSQHELNKLPKPDEWLEYVTKLCEKVASKTKKN